ncbi:MAG TPA: hypothetical protein PLS08_08160, partial [Chryseolinea sp.]|nr:hypothetical protein [Chryseolinea sp.]
MKKALATVFVMFTCCALHSQDFNTIVGDWIRVKAEYKDGRKLPNNHHSRIIVRYYFTKKEIYQVSSGITTPCVYTQTGNFLKIEPVLGLIIEEYNDKVLTLVEANEAEPIRYYMIPIDSFQRSGGFKYPFEVIGADTIYANTPGIEPIYPKGNSEFMNGIVTGFTQKVVFNFSYVVQKDGTIGDVTIKASSNPKLDSRLIKLVKKSSGKWIPAT